MVAGHEATPQDAKGTEHLMRYWTMGPGAAKIRWSQPGDFDRCVVELGKYVGADKVKGLCSNLHQRATGARPGHAPGAEQAAYDAKPRPSGGRLG